MNFDQCDRVSNRNAALASNYEFSGFAGECDSTYQFLHVTKEDRPAFELKAWLADRFRAKADRINQQHKREQAEFAWMQFLN